MSTPDPKLQQAAKEIAAICEQHDIGGYIILASQTHGEYLLHFPKWSKAVKEVAPNGNEIIRFKTKKEELEDTEATVHMLQVFQLQGSKIAHGMDMLLEMLESKMLIGGGPKKI